MFITIISIFCFTSTFGITFLNKFTHSIYCIVKKNLNINNPDYYIYIYNNFKLFIKIITYVYCKK